jgi:hypothetical protein
MTTSKAVAYFLLLFLFLTLRLPLGVAQGPALLKQEDLLYQGAFRLPRGKAGKSSFDYGGSALAYNPENDSLFIVGHDHQQIVAEISIPRVVKSNRLEQLATAEVIQPFTDPTEGKRSKVDKGALKIGGLLVHQGKLYVTVYSYYDGDGSQRLSHFSRPLNLAAKGQVSGPLEVGTMKAGFVSGYMAPIPQAWQASLGGLAVTGNCCLNIISRTSYGPSAFAFDPSDLDTMPRAPATPLLYYDSKHTTLGGWNKTGPKFNGTTTIRGIVFPEGTSSLLYFGRHGIGPWCYGGSQCKDPTSASQGNHAYPYVYQVWAYDAGQLKSVKEGQKRPWDVVPYAIWNFELPFQHASRLLGGGAYDPASQRIFIVQSFAEPRGMPMIHVFKLRSAIPAESNLRVPLPPKNLRVRP